MSKKYYVSAIIGDGTEENPFRPAVADHGVSWVGSIKSDPVTGHPIHADCLVLVAAQNHAQLRGDNRITAMPDFALDGKMSAINTVTKNGMINALKKRGFDTSTIGNTDGYRDALHDIGKQRDPDFNIDKFDVAE